MNDKNYYLNEWRKRNDESKKNREIDEANEANIQGLEIYIGKTIKNIETHGIKGHPYGFKLIFTDGTFWGITSTQKFETEDC